MQSQVIYNQMDDSYIGLIDKKYHLTNFITIDISRGVYFKTQDSHFRI